MGYGTPDAYYQPEALALEPIAEIDYSDGCYQFDIRMVWRHEDGTLYTMRDAGCSCPSPFEDYTTLESLDVLDLNALEAELAFEAVTAARYGSHEITPNDAAEFLKKVRAAVLVAH